MPNLYDGIGGQGTTPSWTAIPKRHIHTSLTLYVATTGSDATGDGTSGNPFASIAGAMAALKDATIANDVFVIIKLADGQYTLTAAQYINHPYGRRISIQGTNVYTKSYTGERVTARSGSAGNWSVTIGSATYPVDVANIAVNDYVICYTASAGPANVHVLKGCHKVTAVDANSFTINIHAYAQISTSASDDLTCTFYVIKTVITSAADTSALVLYTSDLYSISNIAFVGTSSTTSTGLFISRGSSVYTLSYCGFSGWYTAVSCSEHSYIYCYGIGTGNGSLGLYALQGSTAYIHESAFASTSWAGVNSSFKSLIMCFGCGTIQEGTSKANLGFASVYGSVMYCSSCTAYDWGTGFYANHLGYIFTTSVGASTCTDDFNPNVNTLSASGAYIYN